ncbi:hypothetical protein ACWGAN_05235 [Streptomyces sp. NPDC054945]
MFVDTANVVLPVDHIADRAGIAERLIRSCSDSRSGHHLAVVEDAAAELAADGVGDGVGDGDLPGAERVRRPARRSPGRARH